MKISIVHKLSLSSIILVLVSVGVVGGLFYNKTTELLVEDALQDLSGEVQDAGELLRAVINTQRQDVLFLTNISPVQGMLRTRSGRKYPGNDNSSYEQWVARLQTTFASQLKRKASYLYIRFIDAQGQELVTVGRRGSTIVRFDDDQLQNKAHRVYVRESLKLPQGAVFFSEINLNREYGKVVEPHQEVLRTATPIFDEQSNELAGLMVITAEIGSALRTIQQRVREKSESDIYITNDRGSYLLHPDATKTYGFDLNKQHRIQEDIPRLEKQFSPENKDMQLILLPQDTDSQHVVNFTKIPFDPTRPERFIAVAMAQHYDSIVAVQSEVLNEVMMWTLLLAVGAVGLAILFSIHLTRPIKQMTQAIDAFAQEGLSEASLPVGQGDEVGLLARSFASMARQVEESRASLSKAKEDLEQLVTKRTSSLAQSEARQRTILDALADAVITIDDKGMIRSFNPAAERVFNYKADEIIGQNVSVLLPEDERLDHQAYTDNSSLTASRIINKARDLLGRRKDGELFPLDLNVAPMPGDGPRGFVGILRDITERKEAERELNRFKTTLDETMDCVFMFEPGSLKFFYVNAGAMEQIGYSYSELMDMRPYDIKPEFDEKRFREIIDPMIAGKQTVMSFETEHEHKDGHLIPVEIFLQYVDPPGESPRFVAVVRDIAERKRLDKIKSEFISTVSHELRTPLTSIRGSLGLVTGGVLGSELPGPAKEMLTIATNNTERLLLLINDILDIQKMESGQMAFKFSNLELMPFIEKALQENDGFAEQHKVQFVIAKRLDKGQVYADPDRLMQVMSNLLSNAAKFSPEGEAIEVSLARHKDALRISVTDHGPGIPEEFHDKVFEKFTQSDSSDNRKKGGTGLGLSITKMMVEKHGGRIGFVSQKGLGTTFFVDLPEVMGDIAEVEASDPRQLLADHGRCILIVEDDPDVAAILKRMLAEAGYNADIAYDAKQARQRLKESHNQYRLLTLDLMLPGEDGLSFLEELRRDPGTHNLPVVVVSAKADETKRNLNGSAVSLVDWLQKPIDRRRLLEAVKQAAVPRYMPRVLHVEDEVDIQKIVGEVLRDHCKLTWATTLASSKEALASANFDLVLLDIGLPDGSGLDLLEIIADKVVPPRVVIFSANNVTQEYADKVSAVLVKSKTDNFSLAEVINNVLQKQVGNSAVDS